MREGPVNPISTALGAQVSWAQGLTRFVLDSVGGRVAAQSLDCLAPFGRLVSFGAAGGSAGELSALSLMHDNLSVVGYSLMSWLGRADWVGVTDTSRRRPTGAGSTAVGA